MPVDIFIKDHCISISLNTIFRKDTDEHSAEKQKTH
jgi:hypothetical protein